jgi:hypothetical protein
MLRSAVQWELVERPTKVLVCYVYGVRVHAIVL